MRKRSPGTSGLEIAPPVLGGSVFGWMANRDSSFAVLDAIVFSAIDELMALHL